MRRTLPRAALLSYLKTWGWTITGFATALGVTTNAARGILRGARERIDIYQADRVAVALGVTPDAIWGDEWWEIRSVRTDDRR
jgi:plasmid maintenance system antidote protein VapI